MQKVVEMLYEGVDSEWEWAEGEITLDIEELQHLSPPHGE